ncbi:hypothetical protein B9Q06_12285 [Candidatus Marsarchaeota G2 archaeon ECH_B_2]|uniref:Uncharacterized protein n=3 Tax=Candidatus Marsarchaeota group 2 TaxID=2203771 RepID=A0A2R6B3X4_9ARCH|nr:MAG: hypothetical protein B9Q06_12285 [Candidatus Marsarchaeota G2 archaeon ECH_B_2]PSN97624.1 MAG: hypothetical protein B9Q07_11795 [Candidatus Marsarchaeota G2 archaeon ECH_B_3]PSO02741.1 MAG: hypothetical protein B9Q05_04345 [Candidatus Marsarchaeota G2 archaeon ECH_B_1]
MCGLNAQYASSAFLSAWVRVSDFSEEAFRRSILNGRMVRASLMRGTLHIVEKEDYSEWRPLMQPVLKRVVNSFFPGLLNRISLEQLSHEVKNILMDGPLTRAEMGRRLTHRFKGEPPEALASQQDYYYHSYRYPPLNAGLTPTSHATLGLRYLTRPA